MKVNIKVRDNYKSYCSLIDEEKILLNNKIVLDEKKNSRPDYKEKKILLLIAMSYQMI